MNKTETANQLRLAAELIETAHPFEARHKNFTKFDTTDNERPDLWIWKGYEIRPALATPPDGRPLHNPDGLSAEQVGLGYRLSLVGETLPEGYEFCYHGEWNKGHFPGEQVPEYEYDSSCRVPLSIPWPEMKADPYAELKAAHAAGKKIEVQMPNGEWFDYKPDSPQWNLQPECYRIKPEPATKEVELGPEDVPPGSVVLSSSAGCNGTRWASVACAKTDGVEIYGRVCIPWSELFTHWKINRSIPLTGKWDAAAWEPCHKPLANG